MAFVVGCGDSGDDSNANNTNTNNANNTNNTSLQAFSPVHFFAGNDAANGESSQLWLTDGTEAGTTMVRDINPGGDADITNLTLVGETLFFVANDGSGAQVWTSDGTEAGTAVVQSIDFAADTRPGSLTVVGSTVFFTGTHDADGEGIWQTDGTEAGTERVVLIEEPSSLVAMGGALYFAGDDGTHGLELWTSDGTEAGTQMVQDIWEGPNHGLQGIFDPSRLWVINDALYFSAADSSGGTGRQLWRSDGTEAGTQMVREFAGAAGSMTVVGNNLYFYAEGNLWITDGTEAGTSVVLDGEGFDFFDAIQSGGGGIAFGDSLVFAARDNGADDDTRLWIADGTSATPIGGEIDLDAGRFVRNRVVVGDTIYFLNAAQMSSNNALWKTDGTEAGTEFVARIGQTRVDNPKFSVARDGETLLFGGKTLATGAELWRSDGTESGTAMITDLCPETCHGFLDR